MAGLMLSTPLRVKPHGSETIREVATLQDASEILIDWPQARRGPFYQTAREKIESALANNEGAAQAQEAFTALCDHAGLLVR
ncbi:DUF982 domain-containing protein [Mesorhizobium sp. CO1-1-7]|uniref:DUF982 domain-containing protein n=1 Tax=unclassified Mesorhizobium TaxID=325217 RepID=UPI00112A8AB9|nr:MULTISPECIES: DUF982 domain-containing protein [unclassified Mesorhizobium]MBZ9681691.1 DUF982 domain-containing protein [Mesorhizobium sp. CO1-1-2]MBZ9746457.1 DUF982 domain-containing protein [Mesorhizobium sp. CO1-1-7]MBZ9926441.1 DUF982 domain-containing protein [Mesorhizobium sp. BR1-1-4]TPJ13211.1 DUF982 domain-containing protein [Mesorhizobium sp. B2-7-3]TPL96165.1 DUF982 domain-containing protein [Mesorhizobium sp. B2-3-10]